MNIFQKIQIGNLKFEDKTMTNKQIAKSIVKAEKGEVLELPNLLNKQTVTFKTRPRKVIAICNDCKHQVNFTSQNCKCGALLFPF